MLARIKDHISQINRKLRFLIHRGRGGAERSVVCNNCVGAMVLHDYGLRFNSPFVNLFIEASDYLKLVSNLKYYTSDDLILSDITGKSPYPKGLLQNNIILHFMHYNSFAEAERKWRQRCKRIDYDNIYVIFVQQSSCNDDILRKFDKLNFQNRICIVNKHIEGVTRQFIIPGWEHEANLGHITDYSDILGHRYYDKFNWPKFLDLE